MDDNGFLKGVAAMDTIRDTTTPEGFKDAWDKLEGDGWRIVDVRKIDGGKLIELTGVRRRPSKKTRLEHGHSHQNGRPATTAEIIIKIGQSLWQYFSIGY